MPPSAHRPPHPVVFWYPFSASCIIYARAGGVWRCPALAFSLPDHPEMESYVAFHKLTWWRIRRGCQSTATVSHFRCMDTTHPMSTHRRISYDRHSLGRLWRPGALSSPGWKHHSPSTALSSNPRRMARHDGDRIVRIPLPVLFDMALMGTDVAIHAYVHLVRDHIADQTETKPRPRTADARPSARERDVERRRVRRRGRINHRHCQSRNRL